MLLACTRVQPPCLLRAAPSPPSAWCTCSRTAAQIRTQIRTMSDKIIDLLREVESLMPTASARSARAAEPILALLHKTCHERQLVLNAAETSHNSEAEGGLQRAPAALAPPASPHAGEPVLPPGVVIGEYVLANGLHAGQRGQFKALLVANRPIKPEFLVKYVADIEGRTMELLLPEVKNTYVEAHDLHPWPATQASRTPSSAKTRGQQASRAESADASSRSKRKRPSNDKRVRFDERVVVHPPPPAGWDDETDEEGCSEGWLRVPSPQEKRPRLIYGISEGYAQRTPTGTTRLCPASSHSPMHIKSSHTARCSLACPSPAPNSRRQPQRMAPNTRRLAIHPLRRSRPAAHPQ